MATARNGGKSYSFFARRLIAFSLLTVLTCVSSPVHATNPDEDGLPSYMRETAGLGRGVDPTLGSNSGAYTYSLPITIPPGRNGMAPALSLGYSSQSHSDQDYFGYGWQLSIPYIQRFNISGTNNLFATSSNAIQAAYFESTGTTTPTDGIAIQDTGDGDRWSGAWSADAYSQYDNGAAHSGSFSLLQDTTGTNDEPRAYRLLDTPLSQGTITFYMRKDKTNRNDVGVGLYSGGTSYPNLIGYVYFGPNSGGYGDLVATDATSPTTIGTAVQAPNTWYKVQIVIDGTAHTYDVYLDGSKMNSSPLDYYNATSTIDRIVVTTNAASYGGGPGQTPGTKLWVDDISVDQSTSGDTPFSAHFYSSLSGELVPGATSGEYLSRNDDGTYLKYVFNGSSWIVTDKIGRQYLFGTSSAGRMDSPNNATIISKWMLQSMQDTNGNTVTYTYSKDKGQIYPQSIHYTGNGSDSGAFSVDFTKTLRATSTATSTEYGFPVMTRYKITKIDASFNGDVVHSYALTYDEGDNSTRNMLSSVTETGQLEASSTTITLPATTFTYSTSSPTWATTTWSQPIYHAIVSNNWDRGVTVVDVNGDGLADEVQAHQDWDGSSTNQYKKVFINSGSGWTYDSDWTVPCLFTYFFSDYSNTLVDGGGRLVDVNGDLLPDFVCTNVTYLNTGSTWTASSTWNLPVTTLYNSKYDNGARFGDINGDGLVDIARFFDTVSGGSHSYVQNVYLNTGAGWATTTAWAVSTTTGMFGTSEHDDSARAELIDINGDGLADISNDRTIFINTGTGWTEDSSWEAPFSVGALSTRFVDINGDGLVDALQSAGHNGYYPDPDVFHWDGNAVWLNTGSGWVHDVTKSVPVPFQEDSQDTGVRLGDLNGDGINDYIVDSDGQFPNNYPWSEEGQWISTQAGVPDLLVQTSESSGATIRIGYKTAGEYSSGGSERNPTIRTNVPTAVSVDTDDGLGTISTSDYTYSGGSFYYGGPFDRRFAGFNTVALIDGASGTTTSYFHQGNDNDGGSYEYNDNQSKIGQLYRMVTTGSSTDVFSTLVKTWNTITRVGQANFVELSTTTSLTYDGDSSHRDVAVEFAYSTTTGNPTRMTEWGEVTASANGSFTDTGSDERMTDYTYAASSTSSLILPATVALTNQNSVKKNESRYYYDGLTLNSITRGNKTNEERWASSSAYINTQYAYYSNGLLASSTDPRGYVSTYTYDPYDLYISTSTNPLSHTTVNLYDYSSGKVTQSTDPNGLVTQTVLDALDRVIALKQPDVASPSSLVTRSTIEYTDSGMPRKMERLDYLNAATSTRILTYVDGLGRTVEQRTESSNGNYAVKDWSYDTRGLLARESLPYFSSSSAYTGIASATPSLISTYTYDPVRRITAVVNVIGTTTTSYSDWQTNVTDPNGHIKDFVKDAFGNLASVVEHIGGVATTTSYTYDAKNNLIGVTDAAGNVRSFSYDGLSRLISTEDLHVAGDTTFASTSLVYDASGNVVQTTDANSQVVNRSYDALNRMLTEDYTGHGGTETTFTYDGCTYGKGKRCSIVGTDASTTDQYNALGLLASESKTIAGRTYTTTYDYDRLGNITDIIVPDGAEIAYGYNDAGSLDRVYAKQSGSTFQPVVSHFDYAPNGKVSYKAFGNGVTSTYTYDPALLYRLVHIFTTVTEEGGDSLMGGGGGGDEELSLLPQELLALVADIFDGGSTTEASPEAGSDQQSTTTSESVPVVSNTSPIEEGASQATEPAPEIITSAEAPKTASSSPERALPVDAPSLKLKASPDKILGAKEMPDGTLKYAYRSDIKVDELPVDAETSEKAAQAGLQVGAEVASLRTPHARTFSSNKVGYLVTEVIPGDPQYYQDENGEWWLAEYGVTTKASFEYQTAEKKDILSVIERLFTRVIAFIVPRAIAQTTGTFYPDPNTEVTTVDGHTFKDDDSSWSAIRGASSAPYANDSGTETETSTYYGTGVGPTNYAIGRSYFLFDTSSIPDGATISSASFNAYVKDHIAGGSGHTVVHVTSSNPNSNTQITTSDYPNIGFTSYGQSDGSYTNETYEVISLNSTGLAAISKTGVSKFALLSDDDVTNTAPTNSTEARFMMYMADNTGTSKDPKLVVTYYSAPNAPSGLLAQGQTNPISVNDSTPGFTAVFNDPTSTAHATHYEIQVASSSDFSSPIWDTGKTALGSTTAQGQRIATVSYTGATLATSTGSFWNTNTYYWRIKFWNNSDAESPWSPETATFDLQPIEDTTGGNAIQDVYFKYDAVGNLKTLFDFSNTGTRKTVGYTYDELDRLLTASTSVASGTPYTQTFSYNILGNLLTAPAGIYAYSGTSYANPHAPTSVASSTYTYDHNGNLTSNGATSYTWDYLNRLTSAGSTTYAYDFDTNRVKQTTGSNTTIYPNQYWNTELGSASTTEIFANGELVGELRTASTSASSTLNFVHNDLLGSVAAITNGNESVVTARDYYPFGAERLSTSAQPQRGYVGQFYDGATGLNYLNARYYDGGRGQFLSQDPVFWEIGQSKEGMSALSDPQSMNSYSYAGNNPIRNSDPDGRWYKEVLTGQQSWSSFYGEVGDATQYMGSGWQTAMDHPVAAGAVVGVGSGLAAYGASAALTSLSVNTLSGIGTRSIGNLSKLDALPQVSTVPGKLGQLSEQLGKPASQILQDVAKSGKPYIDFRNGGNINILSQINSEKMIRITTDPTISRIISAGRMETSQVTNLIKSGNIQSLKSSLSGLSKALSKLLSK